MNLKQLQLICELVKADFNVSRAADAMFTSQPSISAMLKNLENELNVKIFVRHGKRITGLSRAGNSIYHYAQEVLFNVKAITDVSQEFSELEEGTFDIATTHTQARYVLPPIIKKFTQRYPGVQLRIHQGNPTQISDMAVHGEADIAIATENIAQSPHLNSLPAYQWNRCIVVPKDHALLQGTHKITIEEIAKYPIVTYDAAFAGRSVINHAFNEKHLKPNIILTAIDSDVIKTYVNIGLGIGILASMAFDEKTDAHLRKIDASHLFQESTTYVGFRKDQLIREYVYDFLCWLSPDLSKDKIKNLIT